MKEIQSSDGSLTAPGMNKRCGKTLNFGVKIIDSLPLPVNKKYSIYFDSKVPGLLLRITRSGNKIFLVRHGTQGRDFKVTIGPYPAISVDNARARALAIKSSFANGNNPNIQKAEKKREETFGEFFQRYMRDYSKIHKRSWRYDEREVNGMLKDWFPMKLSHITKKDVAKRHIDVTSRNGPYAANRLLERIKAIYNKAIEWGWEGVNPAKDVKKNRERSRDRFLQPEELPRFLEALETINSISSDFIKVALQTGARKSNVIRMRWDQISLKSKTWRIPETKNGEPLTIPLTESVLKILDRRKREGGSSEWVFPGPNPSKHLVDPRKAWLKVLESAGISNFRFHDLRRTFGSYLAAQGATTAIIGKSLGHKSLQSTKVYERLNIDPVREFVIKTESLFNRRP